MCIVISELDSKHNARWTVCVVPRKCSAAEFKVGASKWLICSGITFKQIILAEYEEGDGVGEGLKFSEIERAGSGSGSWSFYRTYLNWRHA